MKFINYEEKIANMRKKDNSYISTILNEAIKWNPYLDEIIVLCDILRILDKYNLGVSKNEVRKAFNKYYNKSEHGDKQSYLSWIYKTFGIKSKTKVFVSQIRKSKILNKPKPDLSQNIAILQTRKGINATTPHDLNVNVGKLNYFPKNSVSPINEVFSKKPINNKNTPKQTKKVSLT